MWGHDRPGTSIGALIKFWAEKSPLRVAVAGHGIAGLTYSRLYAQAEYVVGTLNQMGLGREDRVAILVPRGPDLSACVLSVASGATAVPLNPACGANEFKKYLTAIGIQAVIIKSGHESPAWAIAENAKIPVIQLVSKDVGGREPFTFEAASATTSPAEKPGFAVLTISPLC